MQERLGRTIKGQLEQGVLYTHLFIDRCKAQMRAAFSAITRYAHTLQLGPAHTLTISARTHTPSAGLLQAHADLADRVDLFVQ